MAKSAKKQTISKEAVTAFGLPEYEKIPTVGLYLEQVTRYINECLAPLGSIDVTTSMVSNYVKKGLIKRPEKKLYDAEQIAYLFFIVFAKQVLSMEQIAAIISMQKKTYTIERAYAYFSWELHNVLNYIFGNSDTLEEYSKNNTAQKEILRSIIVSVSHMIYLNYRFEEYLSDSEESAD